MIVDRPKDDSSRSKHKLVSELRLFKSTQGASVSNVIGNISRSYNHISGKQSKINKDEESVVTGKICIYSKPSVQTIQYWSLNSKITALAHHLSSYSAAIDLPLNIFFKVAAKAIVF